MMRTKMLMKIQNPWNLTVVRNALAHLVPRFTCCYTVCCTQLRIIQPTDIPAHTALLDHRRNHLSSLKRCVHMFEHTWVNICMFRVLNDISMIKRNTSTVELTEFNYLRNQSLNKDHSFKFLFTYYSRCSWVHMRRMWETFPIFIRSGTTYDHSLRS